MKKQASTRALTCSAASRRRNEDHGDEMAALFDKERLPHDWRTLRRVTSSLYQLAEAHGASLWRRRDELVPIDASWRSLLGVA